MVGAVVLAGSPNDGRLKECSPAAYEALIPINARPMVEYVCAALQASANVAEVVAVGPVEQLTDALGARGVRVAPAGKTILENVQIGIRALPAVKRVLVAASDIPLLTKEAVDDFLAHCCDETVDLYYPVVARDVVEGRFTGVKRTYVSLRDGTFTGGNLFLINPEILPRCLPKGEQLVAARKNPLQLSRLVGLTLMVKLITRRLTLREAQIKVSRLLGIKGAAVISRYPEVGVDVDKPGDLELVKKILSA